MMGTIFVWAGGHDSGKNVCQFVNVCAKAYTQGCHWGVMRYATNQPKHGKNNINIMLILM